MFDCYTLVGITSKPELVTVRTPEQLLAEMDCCGVDEAMVNSAEFQISSPLATNEAVAEFCAASDRLHPVWNILPEQTGEMSLDTLFDEMAQAGVKALHARPAENHYLLNGITFGPLLEAMVERNIPLYITRTPTGNVWQTIADLLTEFPRLTLIYAYAGVYTWGHDRFSRPLMDRFDNLYVDTCAYELDGGIKGMVDRYGPGRVLFGTGYQNRPMGGATLQLRNVDIAAEAKELIAHGNLERILGEVRL
jgi:predicted TIM-barrel fold metal-dependent hydrolase